MMRRTFGRLDLARRQAAPKAQRAQRLEPFRRETRAAPALLDVFGSGGPAVLRRLSRLDSSRASGEDRG